MAVKKTINKVNKKVLDNEQVFLQQVGDRLKYYRKKAGYTNYEYFAYEHGFNRPQYGKYEAGANIQLNTLFKLLKALDVSFDEFFTKL